VDRGLHGRFCTGAQGDQRPQTGGLRPGQIFLEKQELPFAETLDEVTASTTAAAFVAATTGEARSPMGVFGEKSVFSYTGPAAGVRATFSDKTPAQVAVSQGKGHAAYLGFHPGLAYMQPALPRRPVDRTPDLAGFTHFVPTAFNLAARVAAGESVIRCPSPLNVIKDTYDHSCY
jgi:hypothetical protein